MQVLVAGEARETLPMTGQAVIWGTTPVILEVKARLGKRMAVLVADLNVQDELGGPFQGSSRVSERSRRDSDKPHQLTVVRKGRHTNRPPLNPIIRVPLRHAQASPRADISPRSRPAPSSDCPDQHAE